MAGRDLRGYREGLLAEAFGQIQGAVARARGDGFDRPTALLIEPGDRLDRMLAAPGDEVGRLAAREAEAIRLGLRPFRLWVMPWPMARALLAARSPELGPMPGTAYPREGYQVAVVAASGVTFFAVRPGDGARPTRPGWAPPIGDAGGPGRRSRRRRLRPHPGPGGPRRARGPGRRRETRHPDDRGDSPGTPRPIPGPGPGGGGA